MKLLSIFSLLLVSTATVVASDPFQDIDKPSDVVDLQTNQLIGLAEFLQDNVFAPQAVAAADTSTAVASPVDEKAQQAKRLQALNVLAQQRKAAVAAQVLSVTAPAANLNLARAAASSVDAVAAGQAGDTLLVQPLIAVQASADSQSTVQQRRLDALSRLRLKRTETGAQASAQAAVLPAPSAKALAGMTGDASDVKQPA